MSETRRGNSPCCMAAHQSWSCAAREITCRRGWRTIFSGWAGIPNARTPPRGCCAAPCCVSTPSAPAARKRWWRRCCKRSKRRGSCPALPQTGIAPERRGLRGGIAGRHFRSRRAGSLRSTADQLQRLAMLVRDRTSNDMWRVLSQLNDRLTARPPAKKLMLAGDAMDLLN
jgi:hypothetical protein